jgi:hypothetical protein
LADKQFINYLDFALKITRNEKRTATKGRFVDFKKNLSHQLGGLYFHVLLMKTPILKVFFVAVLFLLQNLGTTRHEGTKNKGPYQKTFLGVFVPLW